MSERPAVSVIVPFAGDRSAAERLLRAVRELGLRTTDQVILVDNSSVPVLGDVAGSGAPTIVRADRERSSYYARNVGAERARGGWLLFMDADCRPRPDLLDRYFDDPLPGDCRVVAGGVAGLAGQRGMLPAWARSRDQLSETHLVRSAELPHPATGTGNMLVRRDAFEALGGFHEGVRSGADVELCWRLQDAGWTLAHRPKAEVEHAHGTGLRGLARQAARHAAGRRWLSRRYAGAFSPPAVAGGLARSAAGAVGWTVLLQPRRGLFKLIDGASIAGGAWGWWFGRNGVRPVAEDRGPVRGDRSLVVVTDAFPARSETFVYNEALRLLADGWELRVESLARPERTERDVARRIRIDYLEDDAPPDKLRSLLWLALRHPIRCLRDRVQRRRWATEEEVWPLAALAPAARRLAAGGEAHIHAHFAAGGALTSLRLSALLGVPYSLTAHAYDIFRSPRNLSEKVRRATFAAAECEFAAAHMREAAGAGVEVHRIATGTDGERFRRSRPYPDSGRVLAIGRLVEKKGFAHLIEAAAALREAGAVREVAIAGEGPLAADLAERIEDLGLEGYVRMLGPVWGPDAVRDLLETADIVAIPSVPAADGDLDALPLVAYEALAMEVPVVASDLVGLPEVVREPWGRLVDPGNADALAATVSGLMSLPADERADAGRQGRRFVLAEFDPERETRRLAELVARPR